MPARPALRALLVAALALAANAAPAGQAASGYARPAGAADLESPFIAAGFRALFTCSAHFHAGRPLADIVAVELADTASLALPDPIVDARRRIAMATDGQGNLRIAAYRDTMGCTVLPPDWSFGNVPALPYVAMAPAPDVSGVAFPLGDRVRLDRHGTFAEGRRLRALADNAFDGATYTPRTLTTGIAVIHNGRLILERYRAGFGPHSGYRTWSTAKSISAAVMGIAVGEGLLDVDKPAPIPEWSSPGDPRQAITLTHLMRMSSGLVSEGSNTNAIYFGGQDAISAATTTALEAAPGTRWKYANNDTLLLLRALRHRLADDLAYLRYPYDKLLRRIGMYHTRMEVDHAGNFIGSSQTYTTTRDLARFGLFMANDGVWHGERILPEGWVGFLTAPAPARPRKAGEWGYAAQFWLLDTMPRVPAGTYTTAGNKGQYVTVVPSKNLVVVRTGVDPAGVRFDQPALVADVVEALDR